MTALGVLLLIGFFSESVLENVLVPIGDLLQTPSGAAAALALLLLIVAADFVSSSRRMPEA